MKKYPASSLKASSSTIPWEKALWDTIITNDVVTAKAILARKDVRKKGDLGRKEWAMGLDPLHRAVVCCNPEMIRLMVEAGLDVDSLTTVFLGGVGMSKVTCLHIAVWQDKRETVLLLLGLGADCTLRGNGGAHSGTAMDWARQMGRTALLPILAPASGTTAAEVIAASRKKADTRAELFRAALKALAETAAAEREASERVALERAASERAARAERSISLEAAATTHSPSGTASFNSLDSMAKLQQKSRILSDLEECKRTEGEIAAKEAEAAQAREEVADAEMILATVQEKLDVERRKLMSLTADIEKLKTRPSNRDVLEKQLKEIESMAAAFNRMGLGGNNDDSSVGASCCPICFVAPTEIYSCQQCDNWVCENCRPRLETCPSCRQDLVATPLKRNKTAERMIA